MSSSLNALAQWVRQPGGVLFSVSFLIHWLLLFAFWVVLSGMLDAFHLTIGLLCSGSVAALSHSMQFVGSTRAGGPSKHLVMVPWHRLFWYTIWLLREIAIANWQVLRIVFDPKLPIDPAIIRFRSRLESDLGRVMLANSITLTPGTITVDVTDDEFQVHALVADEPAVEGISRIQREIIRALPRLESRARANP